MFCKECGTENIDTQVECIKCKTIINSNLPLDGTERVMISSFLFLLVASSFFFGFGIILTFIYLAFFYISKKDKKIKYLYNVKKILLLYICTLLVISIITALAVRYNDVTYTILIILLTNSIIYFLSDILYFNIIKRHEKWILNNGIFADYKGEKSFIEKTTEKIQTIKKESTNTADELLKWAELKEKGLITDEEFQKGKEKILNGKI
ncbi:SHOCT domain-containing protein [Aliarcobacter cryaerophilus]|uniref:SHOCT domain-containing protein n=1 Tax=Aliarcobacter cryaerophilus TaxID=28198 RepID=UPI0021B50906|nr:SHOCT domain-containing protein [Aliarcobacter cryaerophilus]MCT7486940.1 SHOCT domain-containing protein [Aliarcobacter cryaerophilus]MCT7491050.1 SHOCT domain-containing protein [Aliarcobacter cryaerophilus]